MNRLLDDLSRCYGLDPNFNILGFNFPAYTVGEREEFGRLLVDLASDELAYEASLNEGEAFLTRFSECAGTVSKH